MFYFKWYDYDLQTISTSYLLKCTMRYQILRNMIRYRYFAALPPTFVCLIYATEPTRGRSIAAFNGLFYCYILLQNDTYPILVPKGVVLVLVFA